MSWTREAILRTAAEWQAAPHDAVTVESSHLTLVLNEGDAEVRGFQGDDPSDLISEAVQCAGAYNALTVTFPVHDLTHPAGLADALRTQGAEDVETLDVIAFELNGGPKLDAPMDVLVERVDDPALLADVYEVDAHAFGRAVPAELFRRLDAEKLAAEVAAGAKRTEFRYLARVDGVPVGSAGITIDGDVARLWGGGVVTEFRGRGVYRALLAARLAEATKHGVTLALVKARTGTSSPILRRAGFTAYGTECHLRLVVPGVGEV
jgi:GNAT superfamily N-acetyltransferase